MPLYDWVDKKSGKRVTILRHFSAYEEKPTQEEAVQDKMTPEEYTEAEWERLIGVDIQVHKGTNWGAKGFWLSLMGVGYAITMLVNRIC